MKYFVKNRNLVKIKILLKSHSSMCKLFRQTAAISINDDSLSLRSITKVCLQFTEPCNLLNFEQPPTQIETIII